MTTNFHTTQRAPVDNVDARLGQARARLQTLCLLAAAQHGLPEQAATQNDINALCAAIAALDHERAQIIRRTFYRRCQ